MPRIMTADHVSRALRRIAHEVLESGSRNAPLAIVGIRTRGAYLADRLAARISEIDAMPISVGYLDVGFYRDDIKLRGVPEQKGTDIPDDLTGTSTLIVDDVLFTGRTVRAAMAALACHGRADTTELAVLVDRGHREIPIRANYVGRNIPTSHDEEVKVRLDETDGSEGVWLESKVPA